MSDIVKGADDTTAGSSGKAITGAAGHTRPASKAGGGRGVVWITHIQTSGCGACAQSIAGLLANQYAGTLQAQGIQFARSPRHADVVLLTGALTMQARDAVNRLLATIPEPRALVAVGDCAIDGCVFAGSDALVESLAERLDVNVEIAGCPPTPQAILAAIIEAHRLLAGVGNDTGSAPTDTARPAVAHETTDETLAELVEAGDGDPGADDEENEA